MLKSSGDARGFASSDRPVASHQPHSPLASTDHAGRTERRSVMARSSGIERTQTPWPEELDAPEGAADEYSCPVCGIELEQSNFDTPERDYYCPFCSTRQTPSVVRAA
jgi:rubrerythrin